MKEKFSQTLLSWYKKNGRKLPWRRNITPYRVLISEIMLQQTQVPRVIEKFKEFLELFPTIDDLAAASRARVIDAWSGLGYNRRALLLHKFAQEVCEKYQGSIPSTYQELLALPGIGPYCAGAIASFAFNKPIPAIDVNVRRVYYRYFNGKDQGAPLGKKEERALQSLVLATIPQEKSRDLHNALMDFGSQICLRKKPQCKVCPLRKSCKFEPLYELNKGQALFVADKKKEKGRVEQAKHVPNRIFRGRIVEFTRKNKGVTIEISSFGAQIKKDYQQNDQEWLLMLCAKLERDGLVRCTLKDGSITLDLA